jgi:hypothetical protein
VLLLRVLLLVRLLTLLQPQQQWLLPSHVGQ